jgi:hypothetical protein
MGDSVRACHRGSLPRPRKRSELEDRDPRGLGCLAVVPLDHARPPRHFGSAAVSNRVHDHDISLNIFISSYFEGQAPTQDEEENVFRKSG